MNKPEAAANDTDGIKNAKKLKNMRQHELESVKYFIDFNSKKDPSYRLKHYIYFGETTKQNFIIEHYNKFYRNLYHPPNLMFYPRYYNQKYDFELVDVQNENKKKNSRFYSLFYENWDDSYHDKDLNSTNEYKGHYSFQTDYHLFKIQLAQEI